MLSVDSVRLMPSRTCILDGAWWSLCALVWGWLVAQRGSELRAYAGSSWVAIVTGGGRGRRGSVNRINR